MTYTVGSKSGIERLCIYEYRLLIDVAHIVASRRGVGTYTLTGEEERMLGE